MRTIVILNPAARNGKAGRLQARIASMITHAGLDVDVFWEKILSQPYKDKLRENTEELIKRGGFGSPTLFVDGEDMYFGNDRLTLVRNKVLG